MLNILNLHSAVGQLHLKKVNKKACIYLKINTENNFFSSYLYEESQGKAKQTAL